MATGFFDRVYRRLAKTALTPNADADFARDPEAFETRLLMSDLGVDLTAELMEIARKAARGSSGNAVQQAIRDKLLAILTPAERPLKIVTNAKPFVILMVGINGSGKTTTTAKLTNHLISQGHSVVLCAGDTFRAAGREQLEIWADRLRVPVVAQHEGSDPAAVVFDAWKSANARNSDVLIVDTAGRLHTQKHLLDELQKITRILRREDPNAPHEVLLVIDSTIGRNGVSQAKQFVQTAGATATVLTKLDGSAKGGTIVSVVRDLNLPIRFIGIGEHVDDLAPFNASEFANALVGTDPPATS